MGRTGVWKDIKDIKNGRKEGLKEGRKEGGTVGRTEARKMGGDGKGTLRRRAFIAPRTRYSSKGRKEGRMVGKESSGIRVYTHTHTHIYIFI